MKPTKNISRFMLAVYTSFIILLYATLMLFSSCKQKPGSAGGEIKKDSVIVQRLSDSTSLANETHPLDPHAEDMMRIMEKMKSGISQVASTGNFELDFAKIMAVHHQAAIEMAEMQLRLGTDQKLKESTEKMSDIQKKEMTELMSIVREARLKPAGSKKDTSASVKHLSDSLFSSVKILSDSLEQAELTGNIDQDFVAIMIPHHKGGIVLSEMALKNSKNSRNPKFRKLLAQMISGQEDELKYLQAWVKKNDKAAPKQQ